MMRERFAQLALWSFAALVFAFLVLPLVIVIPTSFSSAQYLQFPPPGLSTRWYHSYFSDSEWVSATLLSARVALAATAIAVAVGFAAAIAVVRTTMPGKALIRGLLMTPMVVPTIVTAVAVYNLYVTTHLVGTFWGIVFAHALLATPFTFIVLASGLSQVDPRFEEASLTMGASPLRTFGRVTVPLVLPSVLGAAVFAFITSWDEVIMVIFIGGVTATTLPLKMFSYLRTEINPTIAAVSTLLIAGVTLAFLLGGPVGRRLRAVGARTSSKRWA